jgi:hypothetical protein
LAAELVCAAFGTRMSHAVTEHHYVNGIAGGNRVHRPRYPCPQAETGITVECAINVWEQ